MDEGLRAHWSYAAPRTWDSDGEMEVTVGPSGVLFAITEEHAVDSYNSEFTSSCLVPLDKIGELLALLSKVAPRTSQGGSTMAEEGSCDRFGHEWSGWTSSMLRPDPSPAPVPATPPQEQESFQTKDERHCLRCGKIQVY